jgi:MFS family permease
VTEPLRMMPDNGPAPSVFASFQVMPGRRFQLLLLTLAAAAASYTRAGLGPLQETMRSALTLSDNQISVLQGPALALPVVMAAVPLGLAIDRYPRVRMLFIFAVFDVVGNLMTALTSDFAVLLLARGLIGFTASAIGPAVFSLLADLYAPAERGRAAMIVVVGQFAGMSAVFALGGALLEAFGPGPNTWRWTIVWLTALLIPVCVSALAMREPRRTGVVMENPSVREISLELWRYRGVIGPLLTALVVADIGFGAVVVWAAPSLSRSFGLPPDRVGTIMGIGTIVSGVLGPVMGGILADFCQRVGGRRRTMSALSWLAVLSVPAALFAIAPGVASASVLLVVFMTIIGAILVGGSALFTIVVPNELRGLCGALQAGLSILFAMGLAPLAVSMLSAEMGGPHMIGRALAVVGITMSILAAAMFAFGTRDLPSIRAR